MTKPTTLPIFPLPLVVCPGEPKPLHIFEARYRALIKDITKKQDRQEFSEFGIIHATDSTGLASVGTSVRIERIMKQYDEGQSDILVRGESRFNLQKLIQNGDSYDFGEVTWFDDHKNDWDEALASEAYQYHRTLTELVLGETPSDDTYSGKESLSFAIAQSSGLDVDVLLDLIRMRDENERLQLLNRYFQQIIPAIQKAEAIKAGIQENWTIQHFINEDDIPE